MEHGEHGVDLDWEREQLNYRPAPYTYERNVGGFTDDEEEFLPLEPERTEEEVSVTEVMENVIALDEYLQETTARLEALLEGTVVPVTGDLSAVIGTGIDHRTYREAMLRLSDEKDWLITEQWERVAEGPHGELAMELYEELLNMRREIALFEPMLRRMLYGRYVTRDRKDEGFLEELEAAEEARKQQFALIQEGIAGLEAERRGAILLQDMRAAAAATDQLDLVRGERRRLDEEMETEREGQEFATDKLAPMFDQLDEVNRALSVTPKDVSIPARTATEKELLTRFSEIAFYRSVEEQAKEKRSLRAIERGPLDPKARERVREEYRRELQYAQENAIPLREMLMVQDVPTELDLEMDGLVRSILVNRERQSGLLVEAYRLDMADTENRGKKIASITEKESARRQYRLAKQEGGR